MRTVQIELAKINFETQNMPYIYLNIQFCCISRYEWLNILTLPILLPLSQKSPVY